MEVEEEVEGNEVEEEVEGQSDHHHHHHWQSDHYHHHWQSLGHMQRLTEGKGEGTGYQTMRRWEEEWRAEATGTESQWVGIKARIRARANTKTNSIFSKVNTFAIKAWTAEGKKAKAEAEARYGPRRSMPIN